MHVNDRQSQKDSSFSRVSSWRDILNSIPVAAYTCDAAGKITYFNALAEAVWGRAPQLCDADDRYCGSHQLYLSDGTRIPHRRCWTALALVEGTSYHGREIVIERVDGGRTSGMAYAHPIRNVQDEVIGAITLVAKLSAGADAHEEVKGADLAFDAAGAMIEVAISVFAAMPWKKSAFHQERPYS